MTMNAVNVIIKCTSWLKLNASTSTVEILEKSVSYVTSFWGL